MADFFKTLQVESGLGNLQYKSINKNKGTSSF